MSSLNGVGVRVAEILSERLSIERPPAETDLFTTAVLDSLGLVELLLGLEEEFGIRISVEDLDLDRFRSVTSIAEFVTSKLTPTNGHDVDPVIRRIGGRSGL